MEFFKVTIAATVYIDVEVCVENNKFSIADVSGTDKDGKSVSLDLDTVALKPELPYIVDAMADEYEIEGEF